MTERPRIVVLCGSTRFRDAYERANREETLAGRIVLSVGMFGHAEAIDMNGPVKAMLDELHLRKVELADEVLVLNVKCLKCNKCGAWQHPKMCPCTKESGSCSLVPYIGESTAREVAHAVKLGKPIRYLEEP